MLLAFLLGATRALAAVTDADPDTIFPDPQVAALAKAAAAGDVSGIRARIAAGADPNGTGDRGVTLLEWALLQRKPHALADLLDGGADPTRPGIGGATVLHMAAMANDPAYLETLLDHGADPNAPHGRTAESPLAAALMNPDRGAFELLLAHHADPNRPDALGNTPLHVAAQVHKPDLVLQLLEAGADPKRRNARGETFQAYFNIAPAGGFNASARAAHAQVHAWLRSRGVTVEGSKAQ